MIEQILSPEMVSALGWTLVHTLWQAALFAVLLGIALLLLRKYSARTRYVMAIGVLGTLFLTVVMTFASLYQSPAVPTTTSSARVTSTAPAAPPTKGAGFSTKTPGSEEQMVGIELAAPSFWNRTVNYYDEHLPLIVTLWLMGVLILQLRFLGQLAFLQRLKNYGTERFPASYAPMLQELETKLGITKSVRYLTSFRVNSPFTAGWLRPAVLFPRGLFGELDEAQLRTIIAHELAHIKRYDFLVNMIQTLLCILFFYHPASWWISARIDEEREHCCDDLAIEATGEAVGYARTLLQLKENELAQASLSMGLLGKGNGFKDRVTRLLSGYLGTGTYGEGFTTAVVLFCFMGLAVTLSGQERGAGPQVQGEVIEAVDPVPPPPPPSPPGAIRHHVQPGNGLTRDQADRVNAVVDEVIAQQMEYAAEEGGEPESKFDLFIRAIWEGDIELVTYFLDKEDFDLNQEDNDGFTPLMAAASEDHPEIARLLLDKGADVNFVNQDGWTALIEAADEGSYATAIVLLEAGADPNLKGSNNGRSALAMAASEGHPQFISLLIQHGADPFSAGGDTHPLHSAAEEGQLQPVRLLISLDADVNITDGYGRTPLSYAAEEGQREVVKLLLKEDAKPNVADRSGRTPLSYAAEEGRYDVVRQLLAAGATYGLRDEGGKTALDYALNEISGRSMTWDHDGDYRTLRNAGEDSPLAKVIVKLLRAGATSPFVELKGEDLRFSGDISKLDDNDYPGQYLNAGTDLQGAVAKGQNRKIDELMREGADLNAIGENGRTPLTEASFRNFSIHTQQLVKGGADINQADGNGATPLTMAVRYNHYSTVEMLLKLGANPDLGERGGKTPREIALEEGIMPILKLLNEHGGSVTSVDRDGQSPLLIPAREGDVATLRYLLEQGTNPNAGNVPAIFLAARERHSEAVRLLAEYKANPEARVRYYDNDYFGRSVPDGGGSAAIYENGTPLMVALTQTDAATVGALLSSGAKVNGSCNKVRYTGTPALSAWNSEMMTERELAKRYDLTYRATGWTPLMEAVETGKAELVKLLLKAGADPGLTTEEGLTARQLALDLGFREITILLNR